MNKKISLLTAISFSGLAHTAIASENENPMTPIRRAMLKPLATVCGERVPLSPVRRSREVEQPAEGLGLPAKVNFPLLIEELDKDRGADKLGAAERNDFLSLPLSPEDLEDLVSIGDMAFFDLDMDVMTWKPEPAPVSANHKKRPARDDADLTVTADVDFLVMDEWRREPTCVKEPRVLDEMTKKAQAKKNLQKKTRTGRRY